MIHGLVCWFLSFYPQGAQRLAKATTSTWLRRSRLKALSPTSLAPFLPFRSVHDGVRCVCEAGSNNKIPRYFRRVEPVVAPLLLPDGDRDETHGVASSPPSLALAHRRSLGDCLCCCSLFRLPLPLFISHSVLFFRSRPWFATHSRCVEQNIATPPSDKSRKLPRR